VTLEYLPGLCRWDGDGRVEGLQEPGLLQARGLCAWVKGKEFFFSLFGLFVYFRVK
jgi:hypothetical protein